MTLSISNPTTMSLFGLRLRREVKDPQSYPSGQTRPTALLRYSDQDMLDATHEALRFLQSDRVLSDVAPSLYSTTFTYTDPYDMDATITASDQIWKLEFLTATDHSVLVPPVSHLEIEDHAATFGTVRPFKFALEAVPFSGTPTAGLPRLRLRIRPVPLSTAQFRLWYIEAPILTNASGDTHDLFGRWLDLTVLLAAKAMTRKDNNFTEQQQESLAMWLNLWQKSRTVQRGPQQIRRRRIGRS